MGTLAPADMFNIGPMELLVILVLALIVVGPAKLPEVGRAIGRALREFRKAQEEVRQTLTFDLEDREPPRRAVRSSARPTPAEAPPPAASEEVAADHLADRVRAAQAAGPAAPDTGEGAGGEAHGPARAQPAEEPRASGERPEGSAGGPPAATAPGAGE